MSITVLSLFDGMSCGQLALQKAGIKVGTYFACEIDKHAISVTQYNFPNTIHLGDVRNLDISTLPKIDLLIGGSPCTDLSTAGNQSGVGATTLESYLKLKEEDFEFKGQSFLFWEYIRIREELLNINPDMYWMLENVQMKKAFKEVFDTVAGGTCITINSALVSAQNRVRSYWSNIDGITQPEDRGVLLKDVLEDNATIINSRDKSQTILSTIWKENVKSMIKRKKTGLYVDREKSYYIDACYGKGGNLKTYFEKSRRQLVFEKPHGFNQGGLREVEKMQTLRACLHDNTLLVTDITEVPNIKYRKLLPIECERLQTVPDNYTKYGIIEGIQKETPKTHRYRMLGNGWTIDVIAHILSFANLPNKKQLDK